MYFKLPMTANEYDCDGAGRLKPSAALRYMQQTCAMQMVELGMPYEKLLEEGMVFLLSKICLKVHRMPTAAQPIQLGTAAIVTRGARFVREFTIDSLDGERLASALTLWILVDPETRKVLRPASFPYPIPFNASVVEDAVEDMRIPRLPEGGKTKREEILIRYSHIDRNRHVNNSVYADFACDALPYEALCGRGVDTLVLSFQNEAKWGDRVEITSAALSEEAYYIGGTHGGTACFEAFVRLGKFPLAHRGE